VYLEIGRKRIFAGALAWPGWCRSGHNEQSALQTLAEYGSRYEQVLRPAGIGFKAPAAVSRLVVVERLAGNTTTDFGAPDAAPSSDSNPFDAAELQRCQALLTACWEVFDATVREVANGKELRKGPRGGGRELDGIVRHVLGADAGYLTKLGGKVTISAGADDLTGALVQTRQAILSTLALAERGGLPSRGPRGGKRWTPRYFVRRVAWHVLDHTWELQDRAFTQ
jgi:hypothetical protein